MKRLTILLLLLFMTRLSLCKTYKKLTYQELITRVSTVATNNPDIFEYSEGYEKYSDLLPPLLCHGVPMKMPLLKMTNFKRSRDEINRLPHVFWIGPIHGDEVVGANMFTHLLERIAKEKHSRFYEMLQTRLIIVLPTGNPQGLCLNVREINGVDPNRDFPYNVAPQYCFNSPSSRMVNEIVRDHLVVSAVVYHGGDNSLTYPWGNTKHPELAPDNQAFAAVGKNLIDLAGENLALNIFKYRTGTMTEVVYPVNGGLEDWIYSFSWDRQNIPVCRPTAKPDYPVEKLNYNDNMGRGFIFLCEAGESKGPDEWTFGDDANWDNKGNMNRNMILSTRLSELTSPELYVKKSEWLPGTKEVQISFEVKGCFTIESIKLDYTLSDLNTRKEASIAVNSCLKVDTECQIKIPAGNFSFIELRFKFSCDAEWDKDTQPESHFVRMRRRKSYSVENNGYILKYDGGFVKNVSKFSILGDTIFLPKGQDSDIPVPNLSVYHLKHVWATSDSSNTENNLRLRFDEVREKTATLTLLEDRPKIWAKFTEGKTVQISIFEALNSRLQETFEVYPIRSVAQKLTVMVPVYCLVDMVGKRLVVQVVDAAKEELYSGIISDPYDTTGRTEASFAGEVVISSHTFTSYIELSKTAASLVVSFPPLTETLAGAAKFIVSKRESMEKTKEMFSLGLSQEVLSSGQMHMQTELLRGLNYGDEIVLRTDSKALGSFLLVKANLNSPQIKRHLLAVKRDAPSDPVSNPDGDAKGKKGEEVKDKESGSGGKWLKVLLGIVLILLMVWCALKYRLESLRMKGSDGRDVVTEREFNQYDREFEIKTND